MEKQIRIIDGCYNELFKVPDGGQIKTIQDGHETIHTLYYLDETHFRIGKSGRVYHICEFGAGITKGYFTVEECKP